MRLAFPMRSILLFIILAGFKLLFAQENSAKLKLLVSARVDTNSKDVVAILNLYENYYNARPDSIYDNPYWNKKEKVQYKDFDFSRESIFNNNMSPEKLFRYFSPFVMSVEPLGEKYQIRVLFSSQTTDPNYAGSKVWCIQKLNAIKEGDSWVLENCLVELSKKWLSNRIGFIEYVYPPSHSFNEAAAKEAQEFCSNIIQRFNPSYNSPFKYYVTSTTDEMGLLENFDYYFVGVTTGKAREGMILTAKGNENYPHEFVHKLLPPNKNRGYVVEEGLAVFLGTKEDQKEYDALMAKLGRDLIENHENINFKSVISQTIRFNGYQTAYPAGAGICEVVFNLSGDEGLTQLMGADTKGYDHIIEVVCAITHLTAQQFEAEWDETVKRYYAQE